MNDSDKQDKKSDFVRPPMQSLHTLDADLLSSMKDENYASNIVKVVTHANENKESDGTGAEEIGLNTFNQIKSKSSIPFNFNGTVFYVILGFLMLTGLGAGAFYVIQKNIQETLPKTDATASTSTGMTQSASSTISSTTKTTLLPNNSLFNAEILIPIKIADITKYQIIELLNKNKGDLVANKIKNRINIGLPTDVSIENFLNKIQYSGPESILRSLDSSHAYNFGLYHTQNGIFETYFLTKIDIFDLAFSGMLDWEHSMPIDLQYIYSINKKDTEQGTSSSSVSTSTQSLKKIPKFTDKVIKNIDTRIYVDEDKKIQIIYGFINKEYLLITSGENSFVDIVNKLTINNILR